LDEEGLVAMNTTDPDSGSEGGWFECLVTLWDFWESTERALSVLAGLVLAAIFCLMPFTALGEDEPWYFWVGSGLLAFAASVLLAWIFFPPPARGKPKQPEASGEEAASNR
jgi:hypothetical protein